jgi:hypothetical protein
MYHLLCLKPSVVLLIRLSAAPRPLKQELYLYGGKASTIDTALPLQDLWGKCRHRRVAMYMKKETFTRCTPFFLVQCWT